MELNQLQAASVRRNPILTRLLGFVHLLIGPFDDGSKIVVGPGDPTMIVLSGNGQSGMVGTEVPSPVVVEVRDGSGQPFANKIVTPRDCVVKEGFAEW